MRRGVRCIRVDGRKATRFFLFRGEKKQRIAEKLVRDAEHVVTEVESGRKPFLTPEEEVKYHLLFGTFLDYPDREAQRFAKISADALLKLPKVMPGHPLVPFLFDPKKISEGTRRKINRHIRFIKTNFPELYKSQMYNREKVLKFPEKY